MEQCVSAPSASLRPRWLTVRRSTYLTGHRLSAIVATLDGYSRLDLLDVGTVTVTAMTRCDAPSQAKRKA